MFKFKYLYFHSENEAVQKNLAEHLTEVLG